MLSPPLHSAIASLVAKLWNEVDLCRGFLRSSDGGLLEAFGSSLVRLRLGFMMLLDCCSAVEGEVFSKVNARRRFPTSQWTDCVGKWSKAFINNFEHKCDSNPRLS